MTTTCETLAVKTKANITATNMTLTTIDCIEPCSCDVTVTWQNIGQTPGPFEPAILVNAVRTGLGFNVNLAAGATDTRTFNLVNLIAGNYNICPDPN